MITLRRSEDRGKTHIDWLDSRHSFSFGEYYDPANESFGPLRVINEDWIKGGAGVFRVKQDDENFGSLMEVFSLFYREPVIVQRYVPEVRKGDKRIILVDGEFAGDINRVPAAGTRLMAPANSPSTRMMRLSPLRTSGTERCTITGSR